MSQVNVQYQASVQYILDEEGNTTGVIVPIQLWQEIMSERNSLSLKK